MTSTIESPGPYDALEKAEPGELLFTLLARDPAAPGAITEWARIRRNLALRLYGDSHRPADKELLAAELRKCAHAEAVALEMEEWRTGHTDQEGERSSYQEVIKTAEEEAEAGRRKGVEQAVRDLREAAYHLCAGKDALDDLRLLPTTTKSDMVQMLARINGIADEHQAKRAALREGVA